MSDDENELALLRMAALQTLKMGVEKPAGIVGKQAPHQHGYNQFLPLNRRKFIGLSRSGALRNGPFNGRKIRNTNLISIPTMESHTNNDLLPLLNNTKVIKLDLPQHRYCNKANDDADSADSKKELSKFSRYDDDDDSDSDSDASETEASENEEKLVRSQSLEALVQELEFEISGEKPAANRKTKEKIVVVDTSDDDNKGSDKEPDISKEKIDDAVDLCVDSLDNDTDVQLQETEAEVVTHAAEVPIACSPPAEPNDNVEVVVEKKVEPLPKSPQRGLLPKPRGFSPRYHMYTEAANHHKSRMFQHQYHPQYAPPPPHPHESYTPALPLPLPTPVYYPSASVPAERPLTLSQEAMGTITMAPLSPRSAAFVLQNREIIEKRKRSPRHSYSRSPSPPPARTRRRSPSPRRYPRSTSPKRSSPQRKMRSPAKRRTRSPERSPKRDVKERLTLNSNGGTGKRAERSAMSPAPAKQRREDPVLEARRKKFEQQNSVSKEGVIRLKGSADDKPSPESNPKDDESLGQTPELKDCIETTPDEDTLQTSVDDLFSDEESEDENEGRFKSSNPARRNVAPVLKKLADMQNKSLEHATRVWSGRDRGRREQRRADRGRERNRSERELPPLRKYRSSPPAERKERSDRNNEKKDDRKEMREDALRRTRDVDRHDERKPSIKERLSLRREEKDDKVDMTERSDKCDKNEKHEKNDISTAGKRAERREGKLYAGSHVVAVDMKTSRSRRRPISARKVAIAINVKENKESKKDDITVIEDDDEQDVIKKNEAGDLRAQLSRKRAERQNQKPPVNAEDVQSRLLHNALGAVFQKSTKTKSTRADNEAAPKEKLPIHRRLGINDESAMKKKAKRTTEQV